ncbi:DUF975 family protein [Phocaeicola vulgatus]|uniref:DUF975 family protein n=1 Tax=Phocaeicola vulgatus TaxID=821 RepID=A0AAE4RVC7_PHOVU|nr:DUF975 family protein [Phocaeicola vulgatus]MDU0251352.1 DUF975 family protein [Phocaeicola vulgatus]
MKTNSELKNRAIDALTGNWGLGAVITLVYGLVMNAPTLPYRIMESVASSSFSLIALLLLPLGFGYTVLFLDVIRGIKLDFARLFDGFKDYGRILGTMLLTTVYTFLWTLLLVIPGIMKSYSYAMTLFILKDYPELQYDAAIEKSMAMMSGHKMKMFLWLSGNFWLVSFKISYLCLPLFYETRTTPSCHPSGCAYRQL